MLLWAGRRGRRLGVAFANSQTASPGGRGVRGSGGAFLCGGSAGRARSNGVAARIGRDGAWEIGRAAVSQRPRAGRSVAGACAVQTVLLREQRASGRRAGEQRPNAGVGAASSENAVPGPLASLWDTGRLPCSWAGPVARQACSWAVTGGLRLVACGS